MANINNIVNSVPNHLKMVAVSTISDKGVKGKRQHLSLKNAVNNIYEVQHSRVLLPIIDKPLATGAIATVKIPDHIDKIEKIEYVFELTNGGAAATNSVWTLQCQDVAAAQKNTIAGTFDVVIGKYGTIGPFAHSALNSAVQIALRALHPDLATATVTGAILSAGATIFTFPFKVRGITMAANFYGVTYAGPTQGVIGLVNTTPFVVNGAELLGTATSMVEFTEAMIGSKIITTTPGTYIHSHLLRHTPSDQVWQMENNIGYTSKATELYSANTSTNYLNGGASIRLRLPLDPGYNSLKDIMPSVFPDKPISISIKFRTGDRALETWGTKVSNNLTATYSALWITWKKLTKFHLARARQNRAKHGYLDYRFHDCKERQIFTGTMTAGTEYTKKIEVNAHLTDASFVFIPALKSNAIDYIRRYNLSEFAITSGTSSQVIGLQKITNAEMKYTILPTIYPNINEDIVENAPEYVWSPSLKPTKSHKTGKTHGIKQVSADHFAVFTPQITHANGELLMLHKNLRSVRLEAGEEPQLS